jgi:tetratricopeptide (TPR) repeat protein
MVEELLKTGRYEEARLRLRAGEGSAQEVASFEVLLELRDALREKQYTQAQKILGRDTDLLAPYLNIEAVHRALEAFEGEDPALIQPYTDDPHLGAEAWAVLGVMRIRSGDPSGAKDAFEEALRRDGGHYRAKTNLGNLALEAGQVDEAIRIYEEVLKQNENYGHAHHNLGAAYRKKGQLDKSVYHIKRAQRLIFLGGTRGATRATGSSSQAPRPLLRNLSQRWWIWLIVIVVVWFLLRR